MAIFEQVLSEEGVSRRDRRRHSHPGLLERCRPTTCEGSDWARQRGQPVWVRLVKGAYWDYETVSRGSSVGRSPCFSNKWETDANFERLTRFAMLNQRRPAPGAGEPQPAARWPTRWPSPDTQDIDPGDFELQMLYGMADPEKQAIVDLGYRLRIYMPYGELIPGMAYLVRRLLENTSNESFLQHSFAEHVCGRKAAYGPARPSHDTTDGQTRSRPQAHGHSRRGYANEPTTDFGREAESTAPCRRRSWPSSGRAKRRIP